MMVSIKDYGEYETAWCPGCGNFSILKAVKQALTALEIEPHHVLFVSGIGQAAKAPHYLNANLFNGLHGRSLPVATGAKLANPKLKVIVESGDGCNYGEGGNHFLAAIKRNIDITLLVHNNQVYGLTKGQASPTSSEGFITKVQPQGVFSMPFNPIEVAVAMRAGFVARSFAGEIDHLSALIQRAVEHPGFAIVDILQQCVSFNKVNTFKWYKERCYELDVSYNPENWETAIIKAAEWGDKIPIGIIYRNKRPAYDAHFSGSLVGREVDKRALKKVIEEYT